MTITSEATDTTTRTQRARIKDGACHGLTIRHLRAFLDQVELTEFDDDTSVRLTDELQTSSSWRTVEIVAFRSGSSVVDLAETLVIPTPTKDAGDTE